MTGGVAGQAAAFGQMTGQIEDENLQNAIAASMKEKGTHDVNYEPIARVDQRVREKDQPTGLRNIGNTCYFNSLLQVYYTLPNFVSKILNFQTEEIKIHEEAKNAQDAQPAAAEGAGADKNHGNLKKKLVNSGMKLIRELQILFATMALGNKKYINPSGVLQSVLDDQGDQVAIGEEKDISEYNSVLLTRIQDAFNWKMQKNQVSQKSTDAVMNSDTAKPTSQDDSGVPTMSPPQLESQSSFADNNMQRYNTNTDAEPARFDAEDVEESKGEGDLIVDNTFSKLFEVQLKNLVEFKDKKGIPQRKTQNDMMSDIVLYIQDESDFYQAWENVFRDEIPDYQNDEDGERYKVSQTTWIESLPAVLTFQLQRQKFMDNMLVKKQHKHPILPEIYPDRFMYENRVEVENLRKNVDTLRKKIAYLKECLDQYHDFNGSQMGIEGVLNQAFNFFQDQGKGKVPETSLTQEEMSDLRPQLPLRQEQKAEFGIVQQMLKTYGGLVSQQIQNLKDQITN